MSSPAMFLTFHAADKFARDVAKRKMEVVDVTINFVRLRDVCGWTVQLRWSDGVFETVTDRMLEAA